MIAMSRKRHTSADPTANKAVGNVDADKQLAEDLQRRQRILVEQTAARNERLRRIREQAGGSSGGDAA